MSDIVERFFLTVRGREMICGSWSELDRLRKGGATITYLSSDCPQSEILALREAQLSCDLIPEGEHARLILENAKLRERVAGLEGALNGTQLMLETIARTNSTDFAEVRERIMSNRAALRGNPDV